MTTGRAPDSHPAGDLTRLDVQHAFDAARDDARTRDQLLDQLPQRVQRIATATATAAGRAAADRRSRAWGVAGIAAAVLVSLASSLVAFTALRDSAANSIAITATQQQVDAALDRLNTANRALEARGQPPVQAPPDPDPTSAIAAAVLAQVLEQLPPSPTADQVADRISAAVLADILGEIRPEVARQTAAYLAANPPQDGADGRDPPCLDEPRQCRGETGETGAMGPPGPPGPPPATQTFRLPDDSSLVCVRSGGPDTSPTYQCASAPTPGPDPTTTPTPPPPPDDGAGLGLGVG